MINGQPRKEKMLLWLPWSTVADNIIRVIQDEAVLQEVGLTFECHRRDGFIRLLSASYYIRAL